MIQLMQSPVGDDVPREIISTVLNGQHCSEIIAILSEQDSVATVAELADAVMARADGKKSTSRKGRSELLTELYRIHIPKLAFAGLLHINTGQQTIQYRANERVESWLAAVGEEMR